MSECRFVVGSLGRAVSPRPPSWRTTLEVERLFTFFSVWKRPRTTRDGRPYLCWGLKLRSRDTHGCGFVVGSLGFMFLATLADFA